MGFSPCLGEEEGTHQMKNPRQRESERARERYIRFLEANAINHLIHLLGDLVRAGRDMKLGRLLLLG
jgi:hypothetical protein